MISPGLKLDVYFGDALNSGRRMANDALIECFARHELEVATLYRGIEAVSYTHLTLPTTPYV